MAQPEGTVRLSNMSIDFKTRIMTVDLGFKAKGKRTFTTERIEAVISSEVNDFFSLKRKDQVKVAADNEQGFRWIATGTTSTSFERFLNHHGKAFAPGILSTLVFECDNYSEDRTLNPFKIVRYLERNTVQMVNIAPKKKTETVDPNTGDVTEHYSTKFYKDGDNFRPSFFAPKYYRRLLIQQEVPVEVHQD